MNTTRCVQITIRGRLSARLAASFAGLELGQSSKGSVLTGEVTDQAQLHGILERIRDLGLELESVTTSEPGATNGRAR